MFPDMLPDSGLHVALAPSVLVYEDNILLLLCGEILPLHRTGLVGKTADDLFICKGFHVVVRKSVLHLGFKTSHKFLFNSGKGLEELDVLPLTNSLARKEPRWKEFLEPGCLHGIFCRMLGVVGRQDDALSLFLLHVFTALLLLIYSANIVEILGLGAFVTLHVLQLLGDILDLLCLLLQLGVGYLDTENVGEFLQEGLGAVGVNEVT